MSCNELPLWRLKGCELLPIVQGGMGVGVSAHRLAGTVARAGAMGTVSSMDLRHHHPDLLEQSANTRDKATIDRINLIALDRELTRALALAEGHGAMDESYLTGEPFQIAKAPGSEVLSGAINGPAALTIVVTKLPIDSRYAKIVKVMEQAEAQRPR